MATYSSCRTKVPRPGLLLGIVFLSGACGAALADCPTGWRAAGAPSARYDHALAYDTQRNVLVLFGGSDSPQDANNSALGDTWEYDGTHWQRRDVTGPAARRSHVMAYDSVRHVIVLVGGSAADGTPLFDTWEWNGVAWQLAAENFPAGGRVNESAMAFDAARGVCVLFGGENSQDRTTYLWNGTTWQTVTPATGPTHRDRHGMAYDSIRQRVVLFGGLVNQTQFSNETWEWDGTAWSLRAQSGPAPRGEFGFAFDPTHGETVLFGGFQSTPAPPTELNDTWTWGGETWHEISAPSVPVRQATAMAHAPSAGGIVMLGGVDQVQSNFVAFGDQWTWNGDGWSSGQLLPPPQNIPLLAFDSVRETMVMVEGDRDAPDFDSTWERNGATWSNRSNFAPGYDFLSTVMAFDPEAGHTLMVAPNRFQPTIGETWAWNGSYWTFLNDSLTQWSTGIPTAMAFDHSQHRMMLVSPLGTWAWTGASWLRLSTSAPGTTFMGLFFDPQLNAMLLCAGSSTFRWNGTQWMQIASSPMLAAARAVVYDTHRNVAVLISDVSPPNGRTVHEWNGTQWTQRGFRGPDLREFGLGYDAACQRTVLFAGRALQGVLSRDTWEWDGQEWTLTLGDRPVGRSEHAAAFDRARSRLVIWGGRTSATTPGTFVGDTWEFDSAGWHLAAGFGPVARVGAAMAYDESRGVTVLFGGRQENNQSPIDVWEWTGTAWQMIPPGQITPNPSQLASITYDAVRERVVLWQPPRLLEWDGAIWTATQPVQSPDWPTTDALLTFDRDRGTVQAFSPISRRVAEFTGETWVARPGLGPPASASNRPSFIYDSARQRLVLLATESTIDSPSAYEYDGSAWSPAQFADAIAIRKDWAATFDSARGVVMLHGGRDQLSNPNVFRDDLWELNGGSPQITGDPADLAVALQSPAEFTVVATSADPATYQWLHNEQPLTDDDRISGSLTPHLTIAHALGTDAGSYLCIVENDCGRVYSLPASLIVTGAPCIGDLTADRAVGLADLAIMLSHFGTPSGADPDDGDLDADGDVDLHDLTMLLAHFGHVCP